MANAVLAVHRQSLSLRAADTRRSSRPCGDPVDKRPVFRSIYSRCETIVLRIGTYCNSGLRSGKAA